MKTFANNRAKVEAWRFTMDAVGHALKVLQTAFGTRKAAVQQFANCVRAVSFEAFSEGVVPVFVEEICPVSPGETSPSASKKMLSRDLETGAHIPTELAKSILENARTATAGKSKSERGDAVKRTLATHELNPGQAQFRLQYFGASEVKSSSDLVDLPPDSRAE